MLKDPAIYEIVKKKIVQHRKSQCLLVSNDLAVSYSNISNI